MAHPKLMRYLVVGVGGFIGANARYLIGGWVQERLGPSFPYGTLVVNVSGCFVLGVFATLALHFPWSDYWRLLVAIGFVGAYTTFSTFEYETLRLIGEGLRLRAAAVNVSMSVAAGLVAAYAGVILARMLLRGRF
ncbi:MAG: fluoride efflux transporter CrcB [Chthonomonadales bacterium]